MCCVCFIIVCYSSFNLLVFRECCCSVVSENSTISYLIGFLDLYVSHWNCVLVSCHCLFLIIFTFFCAPETWCFMNVKKVRETSRECHNHKPQPFRDPKRKRKPTNLNKHTLNKRTKSTKISSLFPKRYILKRLKKTRTK